jgi:hypothetical protein
MAELSTAGIQVLYAIESVAGTRPTSGYQRLPGIKSTPDMNPEPSLLDVTDLSATEYREYTEGLKDLSVAAFTANDTDEFEAAWATLVYLATLAAADDKLTWFCIYHPSLAKSSFFRGVPSPLGESAHEVDGVLEVTAYVTATKAVGKQTAPTSPAVYITPIQTQYIDSDDDPLVVKPVLDAGSIDTVKSSDESVVTVDDDGTNITITYEGDGEAYITVTSTTATGRSAGKTVFKVVATTAA